MAENEPKNGQVFLPDVPDFQRSLQPAMQTIEKRE